MNNEKNNKCLINWVNSDKDPGLKEKVAIYDDEGVLKVIDGKKGIELERYFGCDLGKLYVKKYVVMNENSVKVQYMVIKDNNGERRTTIIDDAS